MALSENLKDAMELAEDIEKLQRTQRELKAGIWITELDARQSMVDDHPLSHEINAEILIRRVAITELI